MMEGNKIYIFDFTDVIPYGLEIQNVIATIGRYSLPTFTQSGILTTGVYNIDSKRVSIMVNNTI